MGGVIDMTGKKYNRLTGVRKAESHEFVGSKTHWVFRCDCGNYKIAPTYEVRKGHTKSCGCYNLEALSLRSGTHRMTRTRLYHSWQDMKRRCYCEKSNRYYRYGGRGVVVCDEWKDSFETFRDWALANGWEDKLQLDRIDNNGSYEPSNCRFVEPYINSSNRGIQSSNNSGYTGVCKLPNGMWKSGITSKVIAHLPRGHKHLGQFHTKEEAIRARNEFIVKHNLPHKIQEYRGE